MARILKNLITSAIVWFLWISNIVSANDLDVKVDSQKRWASRWSEYVDVMKTWSDGSVFWNGFSFFGWSESWEKWANWLMYNIAKDLKDFLIVVAIIYMFILVLQLFFWKWSEDDLKKWRIWIMWTSIWIVVMQMSFVAANTMFFADGMWAWAAQNLIATVLDPIIRLLEVVTSFIFIWMAILAFYRIIASWWNEEAYKKWINSIINAMVWFLLIKVSAKLVHSIYWKPECTSGTFNLEECNFNPDISETSKIIAHFIQYFTWFIWVIVMILIIYTWFNILTSHWDETKVKKAKSTIRYIIIWILIIASSVIMFNFMVWRNNPADIVWSFNN